MEWVKLYSSFHGHPKTLDLPLSAKGLWLDCLAWVGQHETDGMVPAALVRKVAGEDEGKALAALLVDSGLWEAVDGGWLYHNYERHQPDAAHTEARRTANRERQKRWRTAHNGVTNALVTGARIEETRPRVDLGVSIETPPPTPPQGGLSSRPRSVVPISEMVEEWNLAATPVLPCVRPPVDEARDRLLRATWAEILAKLRAASRPVDDAPAVWRAMVGGFVAWPFAVEQHLAIDAMVRAKSRGRWIDQGMAPPGSVAYSPVARSLPENPVDRRIRATLERAEQMRGATA